ncbi:ribonuclease PH [Clostridiaceae bacterium HSG29]|nr:ribonuclease PH [Clostridiaceae bacterium HSG29]
MKRVDRDNNEIRKTVVEKDYLLHADGSVLISTGNTKVICSAKIEEKVPRFLKDEKKGWVTAEYSMLPAATEDRFRRERNKISGRTMEIQRLIGRSLRAVVDLEKLGERTIWIDCDVIQADGGTRTASITGAFIAMSLAIGKLINEGILIDNPINDYMAAVSVGKIDGEVMLDLCYKEDSNADVDMNVVMTGNRKFVEIQGTAEEGVFDRDELDEFLKYAENGILKLIEVQKEMVKMDLGEN